MKIDCKLTPALERKLGDLLENLRRAEPVPCTRMHFDKDLRAYKLGGRHRLLARHTGGGRIEPLRVVTHETYNQYVKKCSPKNRRQP